MSLGAEGSEEGRRAFERKRVVGRARVVFGGKTVPCIVLDLSEKGSRICLLRNVRLQDAVQLVIRGQFVLQASCRWQRGVEAGLEFPTADPAIPECI